MSKLMSYHDDMKEMFGDYYDSEITSRKMWHKKVFGLNKKIKSNEGVDIHQLGANFLIGQPVWVYSFNGTKHKAKVVREIPKEEFPQYDIPKTKRAFEVSYEDGNMKDHVFAERLAACLNLTKKDFDGIANMFKELDVSEVAKAALIRPILNILIDSNPEFDPYRFFESIAGIEND